MLAPPTKATANSAKFRWSLPKRTPWARGKLIRATLWLCFTTGACGATSASLFGSGTEQRFFPQWLSGASIGKLHADKVIELPRHPVGDELPALSFEFRVAFALAQANVKSSRPYAVDLLRRFQAIEKRSSHHLPLC